MGIWQSALILLGIGIVSERFGAGVGLGQLGTGIRTLAAAPLGGVGAGLGEFGGGLRTFAEALGDVGRGFGTLFENIPEFGRKGFPPQQPSRPGILDLVPYPGLPGVPTQGLITVSGGDRTSLSTGGGGNVPTALIVKIIPHVTGGGYIGSAHPPSVPIDAGGRTSIV